MPYDRLQVRDHTLAAGQFLRCGSPRLAPTIGEIERGSA